MDAFVVADLAEQVTERGESAVVSGDGAVHPLAVELGVLGDIGHVLVLCVVLEVGVEAVAPAGLHE
ncbi:MAG TPA: hypothetical protein VFP06_03360, partial [Acidimicrobiales bacterium]|nr:hypothetical protein [Acidimicrobiales bacterium]